jgi:hypothetical protein
MSTAIKCLNCKSTNVHKISGASKVGSALMFGVFAAGKLTKHTNVMPVNSGGNFLLSKK